MEKHLIMAVIVCEYCQKVHGCNMSGHFIHEEAACAQGEYDQCSHFSDCAVINHRELFDRVNIICDSCFVYHNGGSG